MFTANMGTPDRIIRAVVGVAAVVAGFVFLAGVIKWIAIVAGVIFLATAFMAFCPIYLPFRFSTIKKN